MKQQSKKSKCKELRKFSMKIMLSYLLNATGSADSAGVTTTSCSSISGLLSILLTVFLYVGFLTAPRRMGSKLSMDTSGSRSVRGGGD